jgi:hypothetical protein
MYCKAKILGALLAAACMLTVLPANAQPAGSGESPLVNLDMATQALATRLAGGMANLPIGNTFPRIIVGYFTMNGRLVGLSALWSSGLSHYLIDINARTFDIVLPEASPPANLRIQGQILQLGVTVRIHTQLIRMHDSAIVWSTVTDLPGSPFLSTLLNISPALSLDNRDAFEPDSRDAPVLVSFGDTPLERYIHDDDEDWFTLIAPSSGIIEVWTEGSLDTILSIYAGNETSALATVDDYENDHNARIRQLIPQGGKYYIKVSAYEDETGSYTFHSAFDSEADKHEPNDSIDQATRLLPGNSRLDSAFISADDIDWYVFRIPEDGAFVTMFTTGSMDTLMELHDADGTMLADDDDSGDNANAMIKVALPAGEYYLRVSEYDGAFGTYGIQLTAIRPNAADQYEPDDDRGQARSIELDGQPQLRSFSHPADQDWVLMTVTTQGTYSIHTRATARNDLDTYIELYDARGNKLDEDDDSGDAYDALLQVDLEPGSYYIKITQLDSHVPGDGQYELTVNSHR